MISKAIQPGLNIYAVTPKECNMCESTIIGYICCLKRGQKQIIRSKNQYSFPQ